jgi:hypothetical protein
MVRAPAFAHAVPGAGTFVAGLILTLAAATAGGWLGARLALRLTNAGPASPRL